MHGVFALNAQHPTLRRAALAVLLSFQCAAHADDPGLPPAAATGSPSPATTPRNGQTSTLETITVTSQRRSENLQEVPLSVSVISGDDIAAARITNFDDISRAIPGVSFNSFGATSSTTNVVIRGVSSTAGSATVGTYLDDVSITTKNFYDGNALPRLNDLERLEVLRGPQGTLFGASSEGGTIRYISSAPDVNLFSTEITGDTSATQHGGANFSTAAVINTPIESGKSALRTSIGYNQDSGWIDNYNQNGTLNKKGVNAENTFSLHLQGKFLEDAGLSVTPTFFYQRNRTQDNSASYVAAPPSPGVTALYAVPSVGLYQQNKQVPEWSQDQLLLGSLSVKKAFAHSELTSVTGLYERKVNRQQDGTYFNSTTFATAFVDPTYAAAGLPQFQPATDAIIGNLPSRVEYQTKYQQFSQEFRLASTDSDRTQNPLQWVGGIYAASQKIHNTNYQTIPGIYPAFQSIYGVPLDSSLIQTNFGNGGPLFPDNIDEYDNRTYNEKQIAIFGQLDYDFTPTWHAGIGGRFLKAHEDFSSTEIGFYQIGNISPYYQDASYSAFTPKATLSHDLSDTSNVYASAAKGFRLGGPTGPITFGAGSVCNGDFQAIGQTSQPTKFGSDSLWTYELGSKNSFADRRISIDIAGYVTNWSNIQQQIYLPTCGYYFTSNVGNARIVGAEIEALVKPLPELKLGFTGSINHSEITSTVNPTDVPAGAHLIDVPGATYTFLVAYSRPWTDDYLFHARADWAWTGAANGSYQVGNSNYYNPSYGVLNLSLGFEGSKYDFELYAKNALANQKIIQSPEINTVVEGYTVHPRVIGLTGRIRF